MYQGKKSIVWVGIKHNQKQAQTVETHLQTVTPHINPGLRNMEDLLAFLTKEAIALVFAGPLEQLAWLRRELSTDFPIFRPITREAKPETNGELNHYGCRLWPTEALELIRSCKLETSDLRRPTDRPLRVLNLTYRNRHDYDAQTFARLNQACQGPVEVIWLAEQPRLESVENIIRLRQTHEADAVALDSHLWDWAHLLGKQGETVVLSGVWTWPDHQLHQDQPQFAWCKGIKLDTLMV